MICSLVSPASSALPVWMGWTSTLLLERVDPPSLPTQGRSLECCGSRQSLSKPLLLEECFCLPAPCPRSSPFFSTDFQWQICVEWFKSNNLIFYWEILHTWRRFLHWRAKSLKPWGWLSRMFHRRICHICLKWQAGVILRKRVLNHTDHLADDLVLLQARQGTLLPGGHHINWSHLKDKHNKFRHISKKGDINISETNLGKNKVPWTEGYFLCAHSWFWGGLLQFKLVALWSAKPCVVIISSSWKARAQHTQTLT